MGREIERRWLATADTPDTVLQAPIRTVRQFYVEIDDQTEFERRLRERHDGGTITYTWAEKQGHGIDRQERETPANRMELVEVLEKGFIGKPVEKDVLVWSGIRPSLELNFFRGHLHGLVTIEIEFMSQLAARDFVQPTWFGREVTEDVHYNGRWLCRSGIPREYRPPELLLRRWFYA